MMHSPVFSVAASRIAMRSPRGGGGPPLNEDMPRRLSTLLIIIFLGFFGFLFHLKYTHAIVDTVQVPMEVVITDVGVGSKKKYVEVLDTTNKSYQVYVGRNRASRVPIGLKFKTVQCIAKRRNGEIDHYFPSEIFQRDLYKAMKESGNNP